MRLSLIILLLLIFETAAGQPKDAISIQPNEEKYNRSGTCYDQLHWDEVLLRDKAVSNKINKTIRSAVKAYKLSPDDAPYRCDGTMEHETDCRVMYAKHGLLSYYLTAFTYYKGAPARVPDIQHPELRHEDRSADQFPRLH